MAFISFMIALLNVYMFYYLKHNKVALENVALSPKSFLNSGQYWRGITSSFSHYELYHIISNIISTLSIGSLEDCIGSITFLKYITLLVVLGPILFSFICQKYFPSKNILLVGYSLVLCGLSTYSTLLFSDSMFSLRPFVEVLLMKIIRPSSSVIAHLSGVFIGFALRWHLFDWYLNPLFIITLPFIVFFYLDSYCQSHEDSLEWFQNLKEEIKEKYIDTDELIDTIKRNICSVL